MALLHKAKGELADAEEKVKEGLEKFQQMAELNHATFDKDMEKAQNLLTDIQAARKKPKSWASQSSRKLSSWIGGDWIVKL